MKQSLLIWNIALTLLVAFLLFKTFGGSGSNAGSVKTIKTDTTKTAGHFNIAYFEMDSIEANFNMVKDVKALLSKKEDSINNVLDLLAKNIQNRINYYHNLASNPGWTQAQNDAASQEISKMDENNKATKQQMDQEYSNFVSNKMKEVKVKIEDYLKDYNRDKKYSYIVSYEQGLFYYKDTAYNITSDVLRGLNQSYKSSKKD